jgi:hypothetical protein
MKNRSPGAPHPVLPAQPLLRVGDDIEWNIGLVAHEFFCGGMEHHDFTNARSSDFIRTQDERPQVQIADRATGEAPELQMNQVAGIGHGHDLALHGDQLVALNEVADVVLVLGRGFGVAVRWHGFDFFPRGEG